MIQQHSHRQSVGTELTSIGRIGHVVVGLLCLCAVGLYAFGAPDTAAAQTGPDDLLRTFSISSGPLNIAVESPERVWVILPDSSALGLLSVTETSESFTPYTTPTANSGPYDLVYDSATNAIWFTELTGNRIGRLDSATGTITEFPIPTANSGPTGIDIAPNGFIWFVERDANQLARLDPATGIVTEYAYSTPNAQLEDLVVESNTSIWFTAPNDNELVQFDVNSQMFFDTLPGPSARPFQVAIDSNGLLWVTDASGNRIGFYSAGTVVNWNWFPIAVADSMPTGIATSTLGGVRTVWFTGNGADITGRLRRTNGASQPAIFGLPAGSQPWGIAVDPAGGVWIAQRGTGSVARWTPPYFRTLYLPTAFKQ